MIEVEHHEVTLLDQGGRPPESDPQVLVHDDHVGGTPESILAPAEMRDQLC